MKICRSLLFAAAVFVLTLPLALWGQQNAVSDSKVDSALAQLQLLTHLPADEWHYHVGNLAHGEDPILDDSGWQPVKPNFEGPEDSVWFRRWIEVPKNLNGYDLTGTKLWFQFVAYGNGPMPEIIYFNGRRAAMGEDLEPIILLDAVKPGDRVLVAVKLLQTVDKKRFEGATVRVDFAQGRPSPLDLYQEIQSTWTLAASLGDREQAVRETVRKAASTIEIDSLHAANQAAFDKSLEQAHAILAVSKPDLKGTTVQLTGNAHIDAAWLWPWTETVDVVRRTFGTALQLMYEYPQYTYTQSAAAYSQWMFEKYPDLHRQIVDRVKEGRWEMVGGMWVEPDLNMPDGESLVRQLLIGKRNIKEKFGVDVRVGWNPDSFGYNWQLPQIYKKSGIDYFVTQKMAWNDTNQLPMKLFWWQSPDGSRVLTYFPHDYVNDIDPTLISKDVAGAHKLNPGVTELMHLFGVGDHGGGPTRAMLDSGEHWVSPDRVGAPMRFGTAQGFFSDIEGKLDSEHAPTWNYESMAKGESQLAVSQQGKISLPVWNDELYFEYHRGVMTTQANHKRNMRKSEVQLLDAEKYSSLAWLMGQPYPQERLTEAWEKALFNQFHDLAAGSGIGILYKDSQRDYDQIRWSTDEITKHALHTILARVNTSGPMDAIPVAVVNSLAWSRSEPVIVEVQLAKEPKTGFAVLDSAGKPLLFQVLSKSPDTNRYRLVVCSRDVPSLGYQVWHVVPGTRDLQSDLKATGLTLENDLLRVVIDGHTGCITSLYDKRGKFESIANGGCANELQTFKDTPKKYDAWNIDADFDKEVTKLDKADSVELIERGPVRATIRVVRTWQNSKFVQDVSLYAGMDRVDVLSNIDWHETHVLLKAAFPLAASSKQATYEIPYGSIERPTTRNNNWESAKFEVPALRWADLGDGSHGFSLINESKYGYDGKDNVLRLSLLRSPTWPDPEADRGHHEFSYALYPHPGDWKRALTVRRGYEFNYPLRAFQVAAHEGQLSPQQSFLAVEGDHVVLTALKKAEDSNAMLVRFYEWAGKGGDIQIALPAGATGASLTNLQEQTIGDPLAIVGKQVKVSVHPYEIVTVRISYRDPISSSE